MSPETALCGKIPAPGSAVPPCNFPENHDGGCDWDSMDTWQPVPEPCPACGAAPAVEIRVVSPPGMPIRSEYRCRRCLVTGPAVPR